MAAAGWQFRLAVQGRLEDQIERYGKAGEEGYTRGIRLATGNLQSAVRAQIVAAGLGQRLANSVRMKVYPERGTSWSAAGSVYANRSSHILRGFDEGSLIRPKGGQAYLAIPTQNVPLRRRGGGFGGRGRYASPFEVETRFNQDLKIFKARNGTIVAYIDGIAAKNKRGWRAVTKSRVKQGRAVEKVVMFFLVKQARLRKRLDLDLLMAQAASQVEGIVAREVDAALQAAEIR